MQPQLTSTHNTALRCCVHPSAGYGVNPSAGTYRLLHDYPEPQRTEILDFMFKPGFAASFHRIKVSSEQ
jgi:hypothetical protein